MFNIRWQPVQTKLLKTHYAYGLNLRGYRKVLSVCGLILPHGRFAKYGEPTTCGNCRRLVPLSKTLLLTPKPQTRLDK